MQKLIACIAIAVLIMPQLLAQEKYSIELDDPALQKVYAEKTGDGTTFIGYRNKKMPHAEFQMFDPSGIVLAAVAVPGGDEIIYTHSSEEGMLLYTVTEQKGLLVEATTISKAGGLSTKTLLKLPAKDKLVTICEIEERPALVSIDKENLLTIHLLNAEQPLKVFSFPVENKVMASELRDGVPFFSGSKEIPTLFQAKVRAKAFYENNQLIFILDVPVLDAPLTHVTVFDLSQNTSISHLYNERLKGYTRAYSYISQGHLYRFFTVKKTIMVDVHEIGKTALAGNYGHDKNTPNTGIAPLITSKQYSKNTIHIQLLEDYKRRATAFKVGHRALVVLPLKDGGVQVNVGSYIEDNSGIAPIPVLGAVGLIISVATLTARSLHESGKGTEVYMSFNFENNQLKKKVSSLHRSSLNRLDDAYQQLLIQYGTIKHFDYCKIENDFYAVFTTVQEKNKLQLIPFATLEAGTQP